jgi:hypothetical protein
MTVLSKGIKKCDFFEKNKDFLKTQAKTWAQLKLYLMLRRPRLNLNLNLEKPTSTNLCW